MTQPNQPTQQPTQEQIAAAITDVSYRLRDYLEPGRVFHLGKSVTVTVPQATLIYIVNQELDSAVRMTFPGPEYLQVTKTVLFVPITTSVLSALLKLTAQGITADLVTADWPVIHGTLEF